MPAPSQVRVVCAPVSVAIPAGSVLPSRGDEASAPPAGGSRLEAWRTGPGGMPELLLTAGPGQTSVLIPATITFVPGGLYQLWLVAVNSKGSSLPGPVQNWTAV